MRPPARQAAAGHFRPLLRAWFSALDRRAKALRNGTLSGQRLFTLWFGWGLPLVLAGALAISFTESWALGAAAAAVFLAWFYETGRTTCSRCAYHGTAKCGLPGLIAPLLTPKKSAESRSLERVRAHRYLDLWIRLLLNGLCALQAWALPLGERGESRLGASQDCSTLTHKGNRHE